MIPNQRVVYLNGEYRPWGEANVHIMSHSFSRGSAIFEVIGFHQTEAGPAVFRLDEYVSRFWKSASLLAMEPPLTKAELQEAVLETVKRSGLSAGLIKAYGYYPELSFSILPAQQRFQVAIFVFSLEEALGDQRKSTNDSVTACVSRWRRLDPQTAPIEAKVAANYINGIMARQESRERGFDYAVLLDTQGFLAEGGTESLFLVREGRLFTPSLGTVLQSITRHSLLAVAGSMGIEAVTSRMAPLFLADAEEIFLSCTPAKLIPVRQMDERILDGAPGPVTTRLTERMDAITAGRDRSFPGWLFPVC
jgi:branched-chain amino acid aminotransferase